MIVGLAGLKGHGKDSVAKVLVEDHGFTVLRFADPLKNMLRALYETAGMAKCEIEARIEGVAKQSPCQLIEWRTPRHAMQTLGTEWGRDCIGQDLWVQTLLRRAKRVSKVVVPDVRFRNECHALFAQGGVVFRVDAGDRVRADEFSAHSSEQEIKELPVTAVLDNSGSVDDLKQIVSTTLLPHLAKICPNYAGL